MDFWTPCLPRPRNMARLFRSATIRTGTWMNFLKAARGASSAREEGRTENPTVGRTEKSRLSEPTSKPKEAAEPGIPDPLERPRPSVRQALKEIRTEQKQRAEEKARENAGRQKPLQHRASPKKKVKKQKER